MLIMEFMQLQCHVIIPLVQIIVRAVVAIMVEEMVMEVTRVAGGGDHDLRLLVICLMTSHANREEYLL